MFQPMVITTNNEPAFVTFSSSGKKLKRTRSDDIIERSIIRPNWCKSFCCCHRLDVTHAFEAEVAIMESVLIHPESSSSFNRALHVAKLFAQFFNQKHFFSSFPSVPFIVVITHVLNYLNNGSSDDHRGQFVLMKWFDKSANNIISRWCHFLVIRFCFSLLVFSRSCFSILFIASFKFSLFMNLPAFTLIRLILKTQNCFILEAEYIF